MGLQQSSELLVKAVKESYLQFKEVTYDQANKRIEISALDPITGALAQVFGTIDSGGNINRVGYMNWGRPFQAGVDISKSITTIWVDVNNPNSFFEEIKDYLKSPILLNRDNVQDFTNTLSLMDGVSKTRNESDVSVSIYGGGRGNVFFEPIFSVGVTNWKGSSGDDFREGDSFYNVQETFYGRSGNDRLLGYSGADKLFGEAGDDFLHGMHGGDEITGGIGNDTIRGGHGHDVIFGGAGSDWIWGGVGRNTVDAGAGDSLTDSVYVSVDVVQNYDKGNPNGANADLLQNLELEDRIFLHGDGITDSSLSFSSTSFNGNQGIGIFANGTLEALITGNFTASEVDAMTTGGFFA